ncbi:MAG: DMT family transporter [Roseovarius sp.]|nr:DMT family transporter [Roseovarius sp.]
MTQVSVERSNLAGAVSALGAALFFSIGDAVIKFLSDGYALHQVVLLRTAVGLPVFLIFVMPFFGGWLVLRTRRPGAHLIRGACMILANSFHYLGLSNLPLADAVAIFFVSPLVVTVFSVIFLGERVGVRRWAAVAAGFAGVLLIVRPGTSAFQLASLFPMMAATLYALMNIVTRRIGGTESAATIAFYSQLAFLLVSGVIGLAIGDGKLAGAVHADLDFLLRRWAPVAPADYVLIAVLGVSGLLGALSISQAYRLSEAAFVAPFEYVAMPMAVFAGVVVFGTWPDAMAWAGIVLILGSGLFLVWRESRKGGVATDRPTRR